MNRRSFLKKSIASGPAIGLLAHPVYGLKELPREQYWECAWSEDGGNHLLSITLGGLPIVQGMLFSTFSVGDDPSWTFRLGRCFHQIGCTQIEQAKTLAGYQMDNYLKSAMVALEKVVFKTWQKTVSNK